MIFLIIFLKVLLDIFLVLIGLIAIFLFIPFSYSFHLGIKENITYDGTIALLWGLIRIKLLKINGKNKVIIYMTRICIDVNQAPKKVKSKIKKDNQKIKKEKNNHKRSIKDFIKKQFLYNTTEFIIKVIQIVRPKTFEVNGVYGFEDPAFTGVMCGAIGIITSVLSSSNIKLQPVFDDEVIDIDMQVSGGFIVFNILFKTLLFVFKKENRKIIFNKHKATETF